MPLFDDSAFDVGDEEAAADQIMSELDEQDIDEELREAEKKLTKAAYYKALVVSGVVEDDGTDAAAEVNAEASLWARQQMAKLLGRGEAKPEPVKVELPFSDKEIQALKRLAGRALEMAGERATEPVVKPVTAPPAPTVRTVAAKPKPQPKPTVAKPQPQKPQQKRPVPGKAPAKKPQPKKPEIDYDSIPSGQVFTDVDGVERKFVDNPNFNPDIPGSKKRAKIGVANQVRDTAVVPMPTGAHMETISQIQSAESISKIEAIESSGGNTDQNTLAQAIRLSQR